MCSFCTVDPYVSGSNSLDKGVAESSELIQTSGDAIAAQTSNNLAVAASSSRFVAFYFSKYKQNNNHKLLFNGPMDSYASAAGLGGGGGYGGGSSGSAGNYLSLIHI